MPFGQLHIQQTFLTAMNNKCVSKLIVPKAVLHPLYCIKYSKYCRLQMILTPEMLSATKRFNSSPGQNKEFFSCALLLFMLKNR